MLMEMAYICMFFDVFGFIKRRFGYNYDIFLIINNVIDRLFFLQGENKMDNKRIARELIKMAKSLDDDDFGIKNDGWDTDDLEDVIEILDRCAKVAYELENGRRNSYAKFGDTVDELAEELKNLSRDFKRVSMELR